MIKEVLILALFSTSLMARQVKSEEYSESWIEIPSDLSGTSERKLKLVYPKNYHEEAELFERLSLESLRIASDRLGLKLRDDVSIHFDPSALEHNGLTTVIPRNRISVNTEAPESESSIGFSEDYLRETLMHEFGHMLAIQQRAGVFRPLSYLVGTASRPVGLWPRWVHEGLAVWVEEAGGGRPKSGAIARDLRLFSEMAAREKKFQLSSDDLDGDMASTAIPGGRIPYSFGYLIMKDLLEKIPAEKLIKTSARSLGLSYRPVFRELGYDLDKEFPRLNRQWREDLRPSTSDDPWTVISTSSRIQGPFQRDQHISWIENSVSLEKRLVRLDPVRGTVKSSAPKTLGAVEAAYSLGEKEWILVTRLHPEELEGGIFNPNRHYLRRVGIWRQGDNRFRCLFPVDGKTREIALDGSRLFWIETLLNGKQILKEGLWNESCEILGPTVLATGSQPFERLGNPSGRKHLASWSQSNGRNLNHSTLRRNDGLRIEGPYPLTQPEFLGPNHMIALESSVDHWGPIVIRTDGKGSWRIPVQTSIRKIAFARENLFALREFWDREEIVQLPASPRELEKFQDFSSSPLTLSRESETIPTAPALPIESQNIRSPKDYNTAAEILPHFWNPIIGADGSGFFVAGSTFFSDILQRYSGVATAGYSSLTKKGFFSTALQRNSTGSFFYISPKVSFNYSPRYLGYLRNEQDAQDLISASFSFQYPAQWRRTLFLTVGMGGGYQFQEETYYFPEGHLWIPSLALSLRSRDGQSPLRSPNSLIDTKLSFYLGGRLRRIEATEAELNLSVEHRWFGRSGARWQGEFGWTALQNFPYSYFVFGGQSLLQTRGGSDFLSRGYPYQFGIAQTVLRFSHESDFRLLNQGFSLGWNRFRLKNLDLRFVAETLTYSAFTGNTTIGQRFFHTLGGELRSYGKAVSYVDFEAAIGYYFGLSNPRNQEISLSLRALLDI